MEMGDRDRAGWTEGARQVQTGLDAEESGMGPNLPVEEAHNLESVDRMSSIPSLIGIVPAKQARVAYARVTTVPFEAMGSQVMLPLVEHGRAAGKGTETAILLGPQKVTNRGHLEGFARCMEEMNGAPFHWGRLFNEIKKVAFPFAQEVPVDVNRSHGAEVITVRKPNQMEMEGALREWESLWVVDFKVVEGTGRVVVKGQLFAFFGVYFTRYARFQAFLDEWRRVGGADLRVVEEFLWAVRVPPNLTNIGVPIDLNAALAGVVIGNADPPTTLQKVTRFALSLFPTYA